MSIKETAQPGLLKMMIVYSLSRCTAKQISLEESNKVTLMCLLPIGLDDDGYLQILASHLSNLLTQTKPDLVLFDAGVDIHVSDRLGKLSLTNRGIYRRERMVLSTCKAGGYPVASVIGGGLWQRHVSSGISSFSATSRS